MQQVVFLADTQYGQYGGPAFLLRDCFCVLCDALSNTPWLVSLLGDARVRFLSPDKQAVYEAIDCLINVNETMLRNRTELAPPTKQERRSACVTKQTVATSPAQVGRPGDQPFLPMRCDVNIHKNAIKPSIMSRYLPQLFGKPICTNLSGVQNTICVRDTNGPKAPICNTSIHRMRKNRKYGAFISKPRRSSSIFAHKKHTFLHWPQQTILTVNLLPD